MQTKETEYVQQVMVLVLRAAIEENYQSGADTITFSIAPDNPPIDRIIDVSFALPIIQEQLTIQGPNLGGIGAGANIVLMGMAPLSAWGSMQIIVFASDHPQFDEICFNRHKRSIDCR